MPGKPSPTYRAYLLRCWQEESDSTSRKPLWRFSVERILPVKKAAGRGRGRPLGGLGAAAGEPAGRRSGEASGRADERRTGFSSLGDLVTFLETQLNWEDGTMDDER